METCEGPCDLRAIEGRYANYASSDTPAATYKRGQTVRMKYARNNHPPGGFIRLTLVSPDKMMSKAEHKKNAFYYTCWGANPVAAAAGEMDKDQFGFGLIGSDGEQHDHAKGYYVMDVKIPTVVPDGKYVLGWVWYGGTGGTLQGNFQQEPMPYGYFSDYWSCSFVEIQGGAALTSRHTPVFNNDMSQFSTEGCMSANDAPGVCSYEPCKVTGKYQSPRPFKDGAVPDDLTPENFGGVSPAGEEPALAATPTPMPEETAAATPAPVSEELPAATPMPVAEETTAPTPTADGSAETPAESPMDMSVPEYSAGPRSGEVTDASDVPADMMVLGKRACRCLVAGERCWRRLAQFTNGYCMAGFSRDEQQDECRQACCAYCKQGSRKKRWLCEKEEVMGLCGM